MGLLSEAGWTLAVTQKSPPVKSKKHGEATIKARSSRLKNGPDCAPLTIYQPKFDRQKNPWLTFQRRRADAWP